MLTALAALVVAAAVLAWRAVLRNHEPVWRIQDFDGAADPPRAPRNDVPRVRLLEGLVAEAHRRSLTPALREELNTVAAGLGVDGPDADVSLDAALDALERV